MRKHEFGGDTLVSFSIRNLFRRRNVTVLPSGGDRRLAQELVDRGIAAETDSPQLT